MSTNYSHLNKTERTLIKEWKSQGISLREIGRRLNRSHPPSVESLGAIFGVGDTIMLVVLKSFMSLV